MHLELRLVAQLESISDSPRDKASFETVAKIRDRSSDNILQPIENSNIKQDKSSSASIYQNYNAAAARYIQSSKQLKEPLIQNPNPVKLKALSPTSDVTQTQKKRGFNSSETRNVFPDKSNSPSKIEHKSKKAENHNGKHTLAKLTPIKKEHDKQSSNSQTNSNSNPNAEYDIHQIIRQYIHDPKQNFHNENKSFGTIVKQDSNTLPANSGKIMLHSSLYSSTKVTIDPNVRLDPFTDHSNKEPPVNQGSSVKSNNVQIVKSASQSRITPQEDNLPDQNLIQSVIKLASVNSKSNTSLGADTSQSKAIQARSSFNKSRSFLDSDNDEDPYGNDAFEEYENEEFEDS